MAGLLTPELLQALGMGNIDAGSLQALQGLVGQLGPSEEDKRAARKQAAIMAGLGMLGARRGFLPQDLSRAAMLGVQDYSQNLKEMGQQRGQAIGQAAALLPMLQRTGTERDLAGIFSNPASIAPPGVDLSKMGPGGPTPTNAAAIAPPVQAAPQSQSAVLAAQYRKAAALFAARGNGAQAKIYNDIADSMDAQYSTTPVPMMVNDRLQSVLFNKRGESKVIEGMTPAEKAQFVNQGNQVVPRNPYTGEAIGAPIPMAVTPGEQLSANTTMRGQNMADARAREALAASGPVVETSTGFARVGKDNTVTPIVAGGQQLQPKPTGTIVQQIATNNVTMGKIDQALNIVDKMPNAFGVKNIAGDMVMQRIDPAGVQARAMIADIAGQKIHDRSGAAVTVGEAERLKPYVPNVTDTADTVKKKLTLFKREYQQMQAELAGGKPIAAVSGGTAGGGWAIREVK